MSETNSIFEEITAAYKHLAKALTESEPPLADIVSPLVYLHGATGILLDKIKADHPETVTYINTLLSVDLTASEADQPKNEPDIMTEVVHPEQKSLLWQLCEYINELKRWLND